MDHVTSCDWCAARLRGTLSVHTAPTDEEAQEEAALQARLALDTPEWRRATAERLAPKRRPRFPAQRYGSIAAALLLAAGGLLSWNLWRNPLRQSEKLLAQAYTSQRQFAWRMPDAGWSQAATERKTGSLRPPALIQAEALLTEADQADPRVLELQARAHLLDSRLDAALTLLDRARASAPSPRLFTTLAVANALRAERGGDFQAGYGAVIEYTTRALEADPQDRVALFNRALAFERLNVVTSAIESWTRYLAVETDAAWKREAETHLASLRAKSQAARQAPPGERVLDEAALRWLVEDRAQARTAGGSLLKEFNDRWLAVAAEENVPSDELRAFFALVQQLKSQAAIDQAPRLLQLYGSAPAHRAWVQYGLLRAQKHAQKVAACRELGARLHAEATAAEYRWMAVKTLLETATCQGYGGDHGGALNTRHQAERLARKQGLHDLADDTMARIVAARNAAGDFWATWQEVPGILARAGASLDRQRLCLFQYSLASEQLGWPAAAYEFAHAAAESLKGEPKREAGNRARAASMAISAGLQRQAHAELDRIEQLKPATLGGDGAANYDYARLRATGEFASGHYAEVARLLTPIARQGSIAQDRWMVQSNLGIANLRLGETAGGYQHLSEAIHELDKAAATLPAAARAHMRRQGWAAYRALAREQVRQGHPEQALATWLSAHNSGQAPDVVILGLEDGYAVWQRGTFRRITTSRDAVRASLRLLLSQLADTSSPAQDILRDARRLYTVLELPASAARILPDEEWGSFPFVLATSSATVLASAPADPLPAVPTAYPLAVAATRSREALPTLVDAQTEAAAVAARLPRARLLSADAATVSGILSALPSASLFHFAGHGYAAAGLGGLHAADGPLTSSEIRKVDLSRCRLAFLSACLTGIGASDGLLNPDSLVHALLDAGVHTVVASRWNLDSAATSQLSALFYERLAAGDPPATALQQAMQQLRQTPRFAHPYYWAGLQTYE